MTIDWKEVIPETLSDTYYELRGERVDGSVEPTEELIAELLKHFKGEAHEVILRFLEDSMYAHLAKTQRSRAPFYVKNLLAPKNLEFLKKNRDNLREFYTHKIEPVQFGQMVYGAVYSTEVDYLEIMGGLWMKGKKVFLWDLISPSPYWLIFSEHWDRLDKKTVDTWDQVNVEYGGKDVPVLHARARERTKMGDAQRFIYAKEMAGEAMRDAAVDWASRLNFLHTSSTKDGKILILPDSEMDAALAAVTKPLLARDQALFSWARETIERRAADAEGLGHATALAVMEPVETRPPNQLHRLVPSLAAQQHATFADR